MDMPENGLHKLQPFGLGFRRANVEGKVARVACRPAKGRLPLKLNGAGKGVHRKRLAIVRKKLQNALDFAIDRHRPSRRQGRKTRATGLIVRYNTNRIPNDGQDPEILSRNRPSPQTPPYYKYCGRRQAVGSWLG